MIRNKQQGRRGFFLVLVLIVIAVATMAVYSFTELMVAYDDAAYLSGDLVQARVNVESATEALRLTLAQPPEARDDLGGVFNNPQLFQAVTVSVGNRWCDPLELQHHRAEREPDGWIRGDSIWVAGRVGPLERQYAPDPREELGHVLGGIGTRRSRQHRVPIRPKKPTVRTLR